ncbi:hypothetical protein H6775_03810 [Candidatus Nomurabacteria bacterium]|nr:hypothetical protein [Candidatus Nomurabacteria bacterium]
MDKKTKVDISQVKVGDRLSEVQYYEVVSVEKGRMNLKTHKGMNITVTNAIVEECMNSSEQYSEEVKVSRTEMAEKLRHAGDMVFKVCFNKKPKESVLCQEIYDAVKRKGSAYPKAEDVQANIARLVKNGLNGEERVLVGYLLRTETTETGYSLVADLVNGGVRQVDHRSLNWLVLNDKKYVLKK